MLDEAQSSQRTDPEPGYEVGTYPTPTAGGNSLSPDVPLVELASAVTKLVTRRATMFAGSSGSPVLVVKGRCVLFAAEKAMAGICGNCQTTIGWIEPFAYTAHHREVGSTHSTTKRIQKRAGVGSLVWSSNDQVQGFVREAHWDYDIDTKYSLNVSQSSLMSIGYESFTVAAGVPLKYPDRCNRQ